MHQQEGQNEEGFTELTVGDPGVSGGAQTTGKSIKTPAPVEPLNIVGWRPSVSCRGPVLCGLPPGSESCLPQHGKPTLSGLADKGELGGEAELGNNPLNC